MMITYEIFYHDLTEEAQLLLCEALNTTPEEENWDSFSLAVIQREAEEDETR